MSPVSAKQLVGEHALNYIEEDQIVGVGTGSTVNFFIDALAKKKHLIAGAVASSEVTQQRLQQLGIPLLPSNGVGQIDIYVDGADESNADRQLIKGGGAALTGEKILTAMSKQFVCIIDESKLVKVLGRFPLPIEIIPLARSFVAREIVKLGGDPVYRENVITDYGNIILDVHNLTILDAVDLENKLNAIPGVVTNGLFAKRRADKVLMAKNDTVEIF